MKDLFGECYEGQHRQLSVEEFQNLFCRQCKQNCARAAWGQSAWTERMNTQMDRLFHNREVALPDDPRYRELITNEFTDLLHQAYQIEVADRQGTWEIPEIEISDGRPVIADQKTHQTVEEAVKALKSGNVQPKEEKPPKKIHSDLDGLEGFPKNFEKDLPVSVNGDEGPDVPSEKPNRHEPVQDRSTTPPPAPREPEPVSKPVPPQEEIKPAPQDPRPILRNTTVPSGGIILDGPGPPPSRNPAPPPVADAWAIPKGRNSNEKFVDVGATVVIGGKGKK